MSRLLRRFVSNIKKKLFRKYRKAILKRKFVECGKYSVIDGSTFEGHNYVGENSHICNSNIGSYSYLGDNCSFDEAIIGKFCSIGNNVKLLAAQHPTSVFISTSPIFFSKKSCIGSFVDQQLFPDYKRLPNRRQVEIGNDVWVGSNVSLIGGIVIGNGAIIGAGSVVTKNVEPYSVVAGIPAKHIRYRFDDSTISYILKSQWWEKPIEYIIANAMSFINIASFKEKF